MVVWFYLKSFQLIRFKLIGKQLKPAKATRNSKHASGFQLIRFKLIGKQGELKEFADYVRINVSN